MDAAPSAEARLILDPLPSQQWIECAQCIASHPISDGETDPYEWAVGHLRAFPAHDRFRIVDQVNFRLYRASDAPTE